MKKQIDTDIKKLIKLLNEKGYKTRYSCSGHTDHLRRLGYIAFYNSKKCHKVYEVLKKMRMSKRLEVVKLIPNNPQIFFNTKGLTREQIKEFWNNAYLKLKKEL